MARTHPTSGQRIAFGIVARYIPGQPPAMCRVLADIHPIDARPHVDIENGKRKYLDHFEGRVASSPVVRVELQAVTWPRTLPPANAAQPRVAGHCQRVGGVHRLDDALRDPEHVDHTTRQHFQ